MWYESTSYASKVALPYPFNLIRASEAIYIIKGSDVQIGFIADNGGEVVVNEMDSGKATFVPQGAVHFETNLSCEPAELIASNNHDVCVTRF